jgi:hypothetical protein
MYSFSLGAESEGNMSLKNPLTPPGIDPGTVRLVAQRLNHYATPGPHMIYYSSIYSDKPNLALINLLLHVCALLLVLLTRAYLSRQSR